MKTECLKWELYNTSDLVHANVKIEFQTATDIFSMTIYKKGWFGKWKQVFSYWGFSGFAKALLKKLNYWLEEYPEKC